MGKVNIQEVSSHFREDLVKPLIGGAVAGELLLIFASHVSLHLLDARGQAQETIFGR